MLKPLLALLLLLLAARSARAFCGRPPMSETRVMSSGF
jgi:hypothetical protein